MAWTVSEIEQDLLSGKIDILGLSPDEVILCFERTEKDLGREWITSRPPTRGLGATIPIIDMGKRLAVLDGIPNTENLLNNLRKRDQHSEAELTAIYLFRSAYPNSIVELYPEADGHKADFRIRLNGTPWTTVEVTQPEDSVEKQRLQKVIMRFTDALDDLNNQFVLEIVFSREPSEAEIEMLCNHLPEFCKQREPLQAKLIDELGFLFLNQSPINRLVEHVIPGKENTPIIGVVMFVGGGPDGGPHHQVSVRIPFTDNRAEEILRSEAKQLPRDGCGLVMINVSSANGSFEEWSAMFQRRFQPSINTRVSGVCLFEGNMSPLGDPYQFLIKAQLHINPYAKRKLPEWVSDTMQQVGVKYNLTGLR